MMDYVKLIEVGAEGGGCEVFRYENGIVIEKGSGGGMLDEDEDPFVSWEHKFQKFEDWFQDFKNKHKDFWIHLYPLFISDEISSFILDEVNNYKSSYEEDDFMERSKENWYRALGEKKEF